MTEPTDPTETEGAANSRPRPVTPAQAAPAQNVQIRLSTGIIVILVLTLFASCSAASNASDAADAANNAANQVNVAPAGPDPSEVQALCQLLGAVAGKQGVDIPTVFKDAPSMTSCQQVAQEAAGTRTP